MVPAEVTTKALGIILAAFILLPGVETRADAAVIASFRDPNPRTVTMAGSGNAGSDNGPGNVARFVTPAAVAVDRQTGDIFVADAAAGQIREIDTHGVVSTVAGAPPPPGAFSGASKGYRDGKAGEARFNQPIGLAVAPDHSVYVADSGNHCIRRVAGGMVTTLAGRPDQDAAADGPASAAIFHDSRALAIAKDGTIYVADFGVGVRIIKNGAVTRLAIPGDYAVAISDLSLWDGEHSLLFYITKGMVGSFDLTTHRVAQDPKNSFGRATATRIVALSSTAFAVTSAPTHTIFMAVGGNSWWRVVAGAANRDAGLPGGFRDGAPAEARFAIPLGLAVTPAGSLIVADAGNRRIRTIPALNLRDGDKSPAALDPSVYRIAFVSNSYAFYNSTWDDSIAGVIEKELNDQRGLIGLAKPARVQAIDIGNDLVAHRDYVRQILAVDSTALVIWSLNSGMFVNDFNPLWFFRQPDTSPENLNRIRALIDDGAGALRAAGKVVLIADQPLGSQLPPTESIVYRDAVLSSTSAGDREKLLQLDFDPSNRAIETFLKDLGFPYYGTYDAFLAAEKRSHVPLWALDEEAHFSPAGNMFYGHLLASYLIQTRPWLQQSTKPAATRAR